MVKQFNPVLTSIWIVAGLALVEVEIFSRVYLSAPLNISHAVLAQNHSSRTISLKQEPNDADVQVRELGLLTNRLLANKRDRGFIANSWPLLRRGTFLGLEMDKRVGISRVGAKKLYS